MGGLGAPMTVVGRPVDQKRSEAKEARRGRASDEYWCVIDVDQHANLGPAVEKAITNGISVAASNPCVELWFILHYQHQAAEIDRKRAQAISKELLKCDKVLDERTVRSTGGCWQRAAMHRLALEALIDEVVRPRRVGGFGGREVVVFGGVAFRGRRMLVSGCGRARMVGTWASPPRV